MPLSQQQIDNAITTGWFRGYTVADIAAALQVTPGEVSRRVEALALPDRDPNCRVLDGRAGPITGPRLAPVVCGPEAVAA